MGSNMSRLLQALLGNIFANQIIPKMLLVLAFLKLQYAK